jgi:hypothetical protein
MELFIKIKDGKPFEHPILGNNFRQVFPHIDINDLSPEFARFERVPLPNIGAYEVYENTTYERDGEVFKDVHHVRAMTEEEKQIKQNAVKAQWVETGPASWFFDEASCTFKPPVLRPNDGNRYVWDETTTGWLKLNLN